MCNEKGFEILIGHPVKLVIKEPGQQRPHTIYGTLLDISEELILFESKYGIGSYNLKYVIAIKPREAEHEH